jgi:ABC-type nitrate/sulfonate/bicarbonate transport system permease component
MKSASSRRHRLGLLSLAAMVAAYTVVSNAYRLFDPASLPGPVAGLLRPDVLPPTQAIVGAFTELVPRGHDPSTHAGQAHEGMVHPGHVHASEHMATLHQEGVTIEVSLLITAARVLFGLAVGTPLGFLLGLVMGWSRRADDYLHPVFVLVRSVPPLAFITYIMLWLGHSEAHRLIPIVYAVAATLVIPTYHGVRDVAGKYLVAARSLGAGGRLLLARVVLPAAGPAVLAGLRYAIAIAWMTAVGAEMLMADDGMGYLLVGGGLWSSRLQTRTDPAVVMAGIIALAAAGWAMDAGARALGARLTRWV